MSDPTPAELSGSSEDSVRRLLADARHTQPLPPEVASRLDDLLGELVAARSAESGVASLGARRSRSRRGLLLVAAAAAVVAGIALSSVHPILGGDSSTSSDSAAGSSTSSQEGAADPDRQQAPADANIAPTVVLTSDDFERKVRRVALTDAASLASGKAFDSQLRLSFLPPGCADVDYGAGDILGATYDGMPAVLAFRPAAGAARVVELLECGTAAVIRTTSVPVS